jgi:uncharacterized cupredoxin-like copper-binding protein
MCTNIDQLRMACINSRKFFHCTVAIIVAMAVLCLACPSSFAAGEPRVIDARLGSYYIKPDKISVKAGEVVTLSITNEATLIPHNLVIEAPEAGIHVKVEVSAGKSASVTFTPTKTGRYEMSCSKKPPFGKSHKEKGMHGTLEVMS